MICWFLYLFFAFLYFLSLLAGEELSDCLVPAKNPLVDDGKISRGGAERVIHTAAQSLALTWDTERERSASKLHPDPARLNKLVLGFPNRVLRDDEQLMINLIIKKIIKIYILYIYIYNLVIYYIKILYK